MKRESAMEKVIATEIVSPNPESGYNYSVIFGFEKNFDKQVRAGGNLYPMIFFLNIP